MIDKTSQPSAVVNDEEAMVCNLSNGVYQCAVFSTKIDENQKYIAPGRYRR
jgi:hypothetical protein